MSQNFEVMRTDDIAIIAIHGKWIDPYQGKELLDEVTELLSDGTLRFIVNMHDVPQLNSSGLNTMIQLLTKVRNNDGDLVLAELSDKVKELYIMTKLNSIFSIADTVEEAKNKLSVS
ncbi:MAG: STAS domain-containing protein [Flavobacteriales bacterium]|nr:STAS domain-containing protein [Flavobacteriales bacterium]MCB9447684.1 STAS domain-containing protein [Flavobacteriales bacterium]